MKRFGFTLLFLISLILFSGCEALDELKDQDISWNDLPDSYVVFSIADEWEDPMEDGHRYLFAFGVEGTQDGKPVGYVKNNNELRIFAFSRESFSTSSSTEPRYFLQLFVPGSMSGDSFTVGADNPQLIIKTVSTYYKTKDSNNITVEITEFSVEGEYIKGSFDGKIVNTEPVGHGMPGTIDFPFLTHGEFRIKRGADNCLNSFNGFTAPL